MYKYLYNFYCIYQTHGHFAFGKINSISKMNLNNYFQALKKIVTKNLLSRYRQRHTKAVSFSVSHHTYTDYYFYSQGNFSFYLQTYNAHLFLKEQADALWTNIGSIMKTNNLSIFCIINDYYTKMRHGCIQFYDNVVGITADVMRWNGLKLAANRVTGKFIVLYLP